MQLQCIRWKQSLKFKQYIYIELAGIFPKEEVHLLLTSAFTVLDLSRKLWGFVVLFSEVNK